MTPVEAGNWVMGGGLGVNLLIQGITAFYVWGRREGKQQGHEGSQSSAIQKLQDDYMTLSAKVEGAWHKAGLADSKIDSHEDRCAKMYQDLKDDMRDGFDRIETRLNALTPRGGLRSEGA